MVSIFLPRISVFAHIRALSHVSVGLTREKGSVLELGLNNTNALIETTGFDFSPSIVLGTFSPFYIRTKDLFLACTAYAGNMHGKI